MDFFQSKTFCRIRDAIRDNECELNKDELLLLKSDLLTFVHAVAAGSWRKPEDIQALHPIIELILTFFA